MQHDSSHESQSILTMHAEEDAIDLRLIFSRIWRMRKFVLIGASIIVVIAVAANEFFAKYQSEGHFKINNISPTDYRLYQPTIFNVDRFLSYTAETGVKESESAAFVARLVSLRPDALEPYVSIVRSITPKDSKENVFARSKDKEPEVGTVFIGLDLKFPGPDPQTAQSRSRLFAEYFLDSIIYVDLQNWLDSAAQSRESAAYAIKANAIKSSRVIDEAGKLLQGLNALNRRFPYPARLEVRQEMSVGVFDKKTIVKDGFVEDESTRRRGPQERLLSPVTQIVATESLILDEKITLSALLRKQKQSDLAYGYYKQAVAIRATTNSGRELLKKLIVLKEGFSKDVSASDPSGIEVMNEISHELEQRQFSYASGFKFLSGPSVPQGKTKKNPLFMVFVAGVAGAFLMIILALFLSWWRQDEKCLKENEGATVSAT